MRGAGVMASALTAVIGRGVGSDGEGRGAEVEGGRAGVASGLRKGTTDGLVGSLTGT